MQIVVQEPAAQMFINCFRLECASSLLAFDLERERRLPGSRSRINICLFYSSSTLTSIVPYHMCRLAKAASSGVQMLSLAAPPTNAGAAAPGSTFACVGAASCRAFLSASATSYILWQSKGPLELSGQQPCAGATEKERVEMAILWHREGHSSRWACYMWAERRDTAPHRAISQRRSAGRKNRAASGERASRQRISTPSATAGALSTCGRQPQSSYSAYRESLLAPTGASDYCWGIVAFMPAFTPCSCHAHTHENVDAVARSWQSGYGSRAALEQT